MRTSCFLYSLLRGLLVTVAYLLLQNLVVIDVKAQLPALSNAFIRAGKGILLGIPTNKEPGVLGYTASNDSYVVWSPASNTFVPLAVGTVSGGTLTNIVLQGASGTSNYLAYSNNPLVPAMGYLTYTVTNGAGNTLTSILVQVTSGSSNVITFTNNPLKPALGYLTYTMTNSIGSFLPTTGGGVTGSVVITGGLTVYGTQTIYNAVTINSYTQYNLGVSTNFIYTTIYSTNVIYQTTELHIQTNITYSTIDAYYGWNFIGAYLNATGAPYVWAPHFRDTLTNNLDANGIWNFSNATVVGLQGVGTSNTWVQAGTNITISASNGNGGVYFTLSSSATAVTQTGHVHQAGSDLTVSTTNGNGNAYITYGLDMTGLSNRWLLGVTSSISGFTFTNNPLNPFAVLVETGDLVLANGATISGDLNANGNIEIANTKHLRFQDGGGTNRVHLEATAGRLIVTGALDLVSGQAVPFTVNGGTFLSTNGILTGGGNNMLVISNGNGLVYLSVSSNQTAAVTNAVQVIGTGNTTSTPTTVNFSSTTGQVSGTVLTVYPISSGSGFPLTTNGNLAGFSLTNGSYYGNGVGLTNLGSLVNPYVALHITRQTVGVTNEDVSYTADYTTSLTQLTASNTVEVGAFFCARTTSVQQVYIVSAVRAPDYGRYTNLVTTWYNSNLTTNIGVLFRLQTLAGAWTETTNNVSNGSVITSVVPASAVVGDVLTLRAYFTNIIGTTNIFVFGPRRMGVLQ